MSFDCVPKFDRGRPWTCSAEVTLTAKPVSMCQMTSVMDVIVYDEPAMTMSPFSHIVVRDGVMVAVRIYRFPRTGAHWMIEVVDQAGQVTLLGAVYPSDRAALRSACSIVEAAGIHSVVGSAGTLH